MSVEFVRDYIIASEGMIHKVTMDDGSTKRGYLDLVVLGNDGNYFLEMHNRKKGPRDRIQTRWSPKPWWVQLDEIKTFERTNKQYGDMPKQFVKEFEEWKQGQK